MDIGASLDLDFSKIIMDSFLQTQKRFLEMEENGQEPSSFEQLTKMLNLPEISKDLQTDSDPLSLDDISKILETIRLSSLTDEEKVTLNSYELYLKDPGSSDSTLELYNTLLISSLKHGQNFEDFENWKKLMDYLDQHHL